MGEVLLTVAADTSDDDPRWAALVAALIERRWSPLDGVARTFICYFENGFIDEVRRITREDVHKAALRAGIDAWRAILAWSAEPAVRVTERAAPAPTLSPGGGDVWTDGGAPVGPVGDVMLTIARGATAEHDAFQATMAERGWRRFVEVPTVFRHPFDLGMFDAIEPRVRADLAAGAARAGLAEVEAAFCVSTFDCECVEPPPPPPKSRPLPWDDKP